MESGQWKVLICFGLVNTILNIKSYKKSPIIHMKNYNRERNDDQTIFDIVPQL